MKLKYIFATTMMLMGASLLFTSCNEEEYDIATGEIITSVETGDAIATAVSATTTGRVLNLSSQASSSYEVGTVYATSQEAVLSGKRQAGTIDEQGNVTATLSGLSTGTTYYYATYVTLQKKLTRYGEVKSFVATNALIASAEASNVTATKATLTAVANGLNGVVSDDNTVEFGFCLSTNQDDVAKGTQYTVQATQSTASIDVANLLPGTTYYYQPFFKLLDGTIYGETGSFTTAEQTMTYVDLGVSKLWAECNIGAETATEQGILLAQANAIDAVSRLSIDGTASAKSELPTKDDVEELLGATTQTWTERDGVSGCLFTAANGNSIFIPATAQGSQALCWTTGNVASDAQYGVTINASAQGVKLGASSVSTCLSLRTVRTAPFMALGDQSKLAWLSKDGNGTDARIEIYNPWGPTAENSIIDHSKVIFNDNMKVTFTLSGIDNNLVESPSTHIAGLSFAADPNWYPSYWTGFAGNEYEAEVTGDGTYTVWMETGGVKVEGAVLFCIEIGNLWKDLIDPNKVTVRLNKIELN